MTFQIYNYFNVYLLKILLIYTELEKQKNKKTKKQNKTKLRVKETNILKRKFLHKFIQSQKKKKAKLALLK